MRSLVVIAVLASTAHAEVVSDEQRVLWTMRSTDYARTPGGSLTAIDSTLDAPWKVHAERIEDIYANGHWRADATLGASMDRDMRGGVGASIDASYDLPTCRVIGGSASGQLGYADAVEAAWTAGVSGCIPLPFDLLWGSYTHGENVRTSLFDRVMRPRDRTNVDVFDLHTRFYRHFRPQDQIDVAVFDVSGDLRAWAGAKKAEMAVVHWHRHQPHGDQTFRFLQLHLQYIGDEDHAETRSSTAAAIVPVGVEGIELAPRTTASAFVGWCHALSADGERRMLDEVGLHADVALAVDLSPATATARARHGMLAAYGGQLVREDRIAASLDYETDTLAVRGEGFVARQTVLRNEPGGRSRFVGGAAIDGAWSVRPRVLIVGGVEAGRTLDAVSTMDPVTASWDVRATLGVSTHYGVR